MNYKLVLKLVGNILRIEAAFMFFPLIVSFIYGENRLDFLWSILILLVIGTGLAWLKPTDKTFRAKEAFFSTAIAWLALSLFGALPFILSGCFENVVDCIFESVSGFTTTGATILTDVEKMPRSILFWRAVSHWVGGMGVLLFMMAVMPSMNASSINLMRAESTGPSPDRIVPKIRETAKITYLIYSAMTVILILLLKIVGLPLFDSIVTAFSVAGTGGFSITNASIGSYNNISAEIIITIFMFLFGISFALYFFLLGKKFTKFIKDNELKFYIFIVLSAILIITVNITGLYGGIGEALRHSSFQVSSVISSTGFATTDFNLWPTLSKVILVLLMLTGCCAGSTGGGIKLIRILILIKAAKIEIGKILHPDNVEPVSINEKRINNDIVSKTALYTFIYFVVFIVSLLLISIEGKDLVTSTTAVITCISNIGPGLEVVGPVGNFSSFTSFSKVVFSLGMIAGRLEFLPILILFTPSVWKRR